VFDDHRGQAGGLTGTRPCPRPLSRSLDPIAGESLGGYLLRLSWRLRVSPLHLARLTGCADDGPAVIRRRLLPGLDVQRFAQATRLSADEASSLTVASWADRYPPITRSRIGPDPPIVLDGWLFSTSIRYCPDCLAGNSSLVQQQYGGPWKKTWHLPVTFACLQHQRFLHEGCAQAHPGIPAARPPGGSSPSPPPAPCILPSAACPCKQEEPAGTALPAASARPSPARTAVPGPAREPWTSRNTSSPCSARSTPPKTPPAPSPTCE
jgi:TniQ